MYSSKIVNTRRNHISMEEIRGRKGSFPTFLGSKVQGSRDDVVGMMSDE